mgnify:CR=1 FL=1|tara:strand:+ start:2072 stop:3073 length:1002 start_codon:yes stop_codon:yes gene_type:complete
MFFNISNQLRLFGTLIVALTFAFLINNFFNFWGNWPGVDSFFANKGLFGFKELNEPLKGSLAIKAWLQFLIYLGVIFLCFFYIIITSDKKLKDEADLFAKLSAYIIRSSFWLVFLIGIVDMILSFLRVEDFLIPIFGNELGIDLGRSNFRGTYIHFPIILLSLILGYYTKTLGFLWLAFLVVIAEFQIVIARFIFSYEQTFMGDLVRFWYGALFLFSSSYALIHEGHVRVDILFTNFSKKGKALSNLLGSLLLGVPICWVILLRGMWCKQCIINAPLTNFETSMSGYGMQVKYLMAGFLAIYALTMLIQFISFFLSNSYKLLENDDSLKSSNI